LLSNPILGLVSGQVLQQVNFKQGLQTGFEFIKSCHTGIIIGAWGGLCKPTLDKKSAAELRLGG
jgi:hypothetical protein